MDALKNWLEGLGVNLAYLFLIAGFVCMLLAFAVTNVTFETVLGYAIALSPIWLPVILFFTFFEYWMYYTRKHFSLEQGRVTLEILIPEEIMKSPQAMELVIAQMFQKASPDNLVQTYWEGKHPPTFGLEIVSHGGSIHFYISAPRKKFKNIIEAQLYSQYPGIEVRELPIDYTAEIAKDSEDFEIFSIHFGKKEANPLPIKTYVDYKLDMMPKEEEKIDPITQMLDMMGSINPAERVWVQFLISAHRTEDFQVGSLRTKPDWKGELKALINDLALRDGKRMGTFEIGGNMPRVTEGENQLIAQLEKRQGQYAFNTIIRVLYGAKKGHALFGERIGAIITSWYPYQGANGIGVKWRTDINWPWWQDPSGKRVAAWRETELDEYKRRTHQTRQAGDTDSIFTTEELATMFHLPGRVATTPTLSRIPSARAEAPPNLPTGTP